MQAAINRGWAEAKPVWIPESSTAHSLGANTLHWFHSDAETFSCPWFSGICANWDPVPNTSQTYGPSGPYPGGWIAGENNGVEIETSAGSAFATEGFAGGFIQGISFKSMDATATVVDIENYFDALSGSVGPNTVHSVLQDVSTEGGSDAFWARPDPLTIA